MLSLAQPISFSTASSYSNSSFGNPFAALAEEELSPTLTGGTKVLPEVSSEETLLMIAMQLRGLNHFFLEAIKSQIHIDQLGSLKHLTLEYNKYLTEIEYTYDSEVVNRAKKLVNSTHEQNSNQTNSHSVQSNQPFLPKQSEIKSSPFSSFTPKANENSEPIKFSFAQSKVHNPPPNTMPSFSFTPNIPTATIPTNFSAPTTQKSPLVSFGSTMTKPNDTVIPPFSFVPKATEISDVPKGQTPFSYGPLKTEPISTPFSFGPPVTQPTAKIVPSFSFGPVKTNETTNTPFGQFGSGSSHPSFGIQSAQPNATPAFSFKPAQTEAPEISAFSFNSVSSQPPVTSAFSFAPQSTTPFSQQPTAIDADDALTPEEEAQRKLDEAESEKLKTAILQNEPGESTLFQTRCKVSRMQSGTWVDVGLGNLNLNQMAGNKKRLLLKSDSGRVLLNAFMFKVSLLFDKVSIL